MSESRKKNRKRPSLQPGGPAHSRSFRAARNLIDSGKAQEGLALLNQLASTSQDPARRGRIAVIIAASESRLSRHRDAGAAFARAADLGRQAGALGLVFQGGIGEIRSLLRSLRLEEAEIAAGRLVAEFDDSWSSFDQIASLSTEELENRGFVNLPPRPPRPTVVLTKIANAFVESGHTAEARVYLEKAVLLSPNGASRARQLLARLALAADEPALAERYAREALQVGRFQAKTVSAWQLYLDARARQGLVPILEHWLFQSLSAHAADRIYSASCLSIIRVLRGHGDSYWKEVAATALANQDSADPIIATEIEKILHADAKLTLSEPPEALAARALRFFNARDVPRESKSPTPRNTYTMLWMPVRNLIWQ